MTRITDHSRRRFLQLAARAAGASAALSIFPPSIRRALALPAATRTGTIDDVRHVVILMQENRSFDHYFGTLRGVRGFGDRHPIPLASGKPVWFQSDGEKEVPPFRLDTRTTSALRTPGTPHAFDDAQAAWGQGTLSHWPKFKTSVSMGHYRREDIPSQFALAEAFTICDAHHCSVTTGTDPNRIAFLSGSNFDPEHRARGENCTDADAEVNNLRCQIEAQHPDPGYNYQGSAFRWPTLPELLGQAGISWRIYQDPNDNWTGLMHGGLAFESFRKATPGTSIYDNGMTRWSLDDFAADVKRGSLPSVSWILPTKLDSEHPWASSSLQGADFTSRVIDALTANPEIWGETVLFLTFDENDGLFDHVPPPAPPSHNLDGSLAGKATLDLRGQYFSDPQRIYLHPDDQISGPLRPYGLGARVPLYVISPWSRGGWVNSQVFDHTSVGQFLEKRFGITVPGISPWHRAVSGDLTSAFDFRNANEAAFPEMPRIVDKDAALAAAAQRPKPDAPEVHEALFQEPGVRRSRAIPYELHVETRVRDAAITLVFRNTGAMGAVFHVYDKLHLDRIPRRFTVEAGKSLDDRWSVIDDSGRYHLWVYGPNGFVREFVGLAAARHVEFGLRYHAENREIELIARNAGSRDVDVAIQSNAYGNVGSEVLRLARGRTASRRFSLVSSHCWYDFTVSHGDVRHRFAGRLETGEHGFSDPAIGA